MSRPSSAPGPRPRAVPRLAPSAASSGWGWIEWFIVSQAILPALLFLPGLSTAGGPFRPLLRVSSYLIGVLIWFATWQRVGETGLSASFPSRRWLAWTIAWLALMLTHPNSYSPPAALAQMMLYISVLSPAMWATEAVSWPGQIVRIMAVLFLCNALSASLGLAQVYSTRFYPPYIPVVENIYEGENFKVEIDGRMIFRPCGLTDTPGAAAPAGATAALLGLAFALRPIGPLRRGLAAALAFIGFAVIYYTQIRSTMLVLAASLVVFTLLLGARRRYGAAFSLAAGGMGMLVGAFAWASRRMNASEVSRFGDLMSTGLGDSVRRNRGWFVHEALTRLTLEYPLGDGMGWWGMIHGMFQRPSKVSTVWVEIMLSGWIYDGGIPLLVLYCGAMGLAVRNSLRIALKNPDPEVSFWAAVVTAQNVSTMVLCFTYPVFVSPIGQVFWLLNGAIHAADYRSRRAPRWA